MNILNLFKNTYVSIIFLLPVLVFPQNGLNKDGELPVSLEKLEVIFQNQGLLNMPVTLFNKTTTKVNVGNYGDGKIKKNSPSETNTKIIGISYKETKFKFFIDFTNSLNETSKLIGTKKNNSISASIMATLSTISENSKPWNVNLKIDKINFLNNDLGQLTEGQRIIKVIRTNYRMYQKNEKNSHISPNSIIYEFTENAMSLGAVTFEEENSIWLNSDLDSATKLVLCTTMLALAN